MGSLLDIPLAEKPATPATPQERKQLARAVIYFFQELGARLNARREEERQRELDLLEAATAIQPWWERLPAIGLAAEPEQPKQSRRGNRRVVRECTRRIREKYSGGAPGGTSVAAVRRKISDKGEDGFHPGWDAVKAALVALGYILPKE
jgi:hypothetical protein